jgi:hypothetical protein
MQCLSRVWLLAFLVLAYGCSSMSPRIVPLDAAADRETIAGAKTQINNLKTRLNNKLNGQQRDIALARMGVLGGALAAGVGALYGAHRDMILGAGLVGGTSAAVGPLYTPAVYGDIYDAALSAAHCLDNFATPAAALLPIIKDERSALDRETSALASMVTGGTPQDAVNALADARAALQRADGTLRKEPLLAGTLLLAADEIVRIANKQLRDNAPNLDAFAAAGRTIFASASSLPGVAPPDEPKDAGAAKAPAPPTTPEQIAAQVKRVNEARVALVAHLDAFDRLGDPQQTNCADKAKIDAAKPLTTTAQNGTVSLKVKEPYSLLISGGRPPYHSDWIGTIPPADTVEAKLTPFGSTVQFTAKKAFSGYKYVIQDAVGTKVELSVSASDKGDGK